MVFVFRKVKLIIIQVKMKNDNSSGNENIDNTSEVSETGVDNSNNNKTNI